MTTTTRMSTPRYLDPSQGRYCGSCQLCDMEDPFVPSRTAYCSKHDAAVKINIITNCRDYLPIRG